MKISGSLSAVLILLIMLLYGLLHLPSVQTWLVNRITASLSKQLKTKVQVASVDFRFFDQLQLKGLLIEDRNRDTLLYAGTLGVNINDWFFFKDKYILKRITIKDGKVNLIRNDSTWNYQFLADFFSDTSTGKSSQTPLELQHVKIESFKCNQIDRWVGQDMHFSMGTLDLLVDSFALPSKKIVLSHLRIASPSFWQFEYPGKKPKGLKSKPKQPAPEENIDNPWVVQADAIQLINGSFKLDKESDSSPYTDRFDGEHLDFTDIDAHLSNVRLAGDSLVLGLKIDGKEKSGLQVKSLSADILFNSKVMAFRNLDLQTNKSRIRDYYAMHYNSFLNDMNDYIDSVVMEGHFTKSEIHSDDIAFFDPVLKTMNRSFTLSGNARGSVAKMEARDVDLQTGQSRFQGQAHLRGMYNTDSLFISLSCNSLSSTASEITSLSPALKHNKSIHFQELGNIQFNGILSGSLKQIKADGIVITSLGNINTRFLMQDPAQSKATYSGHAVTNSFQLGKFLGVLSLGAISTDMSFSGGIASGNIEFKGTVPSLGFGGYTYRDLSVNGRFENNTLTGALSSNDPNLTIKDLMTTLQFTKSGMKGRAKGQLDVIRLRALGLTDKEINFSGMIDVNMEGDNIDNFLGSAALRNGRVFDATNAQSIDSAILTSVIRNNSKLLSLHSSQIDAEINGQFSLAELPEAFKYFLSRYYPAYFNVSEKPKSKQSFQFSVKTRDISDYLKYLPGNLDGFDNSELSGNLDIDNNRLHVSGRIPYWGIKNRKFNTMNFLAAGNEDSLRLDAAVDDIQITDSIHLPGTRLSMISRNDISNIHLRTKATETLNDATLNATVQTLPDGVTIHFEPSSFIINEKKWELEKGGEITLKKNAIEAKDIKFTEGYQEIALSSSQTENGDPVLNADLKNVNLEDFMPFIVTEPEVKGLLTGQASITDPGGNKIIEFKGKANDLMMDGKSIGNVSINANGDISKGPIDFSAVSEKGSNVFNIDGRYNIQDSTGNNLLVNMVGDDIDLRILEPYLSSIFSSIEGRASSKLKLVNENHKTYIMGDVLVKDGSITVGYTQCRYLLKNQKINFGKGDITVNNLILKDTLNNEAVLRGSMKHDLFNDISFNKVRMETSRLLLLNTSKKDNELFYGNIIGSAIMKLSGPLNNMKMGIDGAPSLRDSSHIYLLTGSSKESKSQDYIEFVNFGSSSIQQKWSNEDANIVVDMNIDANPSCKVDVILDESTGDIIKGSGRGLINIKAGNREPLSVRGRYELSSGEYTFNFQTFFKKPFELNKGNITWNGNPYDAIIDINADYQAKNVNISSILPAGSLRQKEDIFIVSRLTGNLSKPQIKFEFKLPEKSELNRDYIIVKKLADLQNDDNEMNKQVASLLLFNTFLSENQNFFSGENTMAFATSTVGGIISNWLTNIFNKQLEQATNGMLSTYIDINPSLSLQNNSNEIQANVRAGLKLLLSNRLVFLVGGNLDYNNPYVQLERKGLLTPDITLEWLLNKEGSVRVVGFHRSSFDLSLGQRNRSGARLSYRKDFDNIGDIFKSRKKIDEQAVKREGGE